jgi:membrane-associated phospholipid phosphatase
MSRRLVAVAWREFKPRVIPTLLCGIYALVVNLNVDAWREQDQFFVERDPQLAYPALPSTVSMTQLVLVGCALPFAVILGLAAWASRERASHFAQETALVWWLRQSFALGNTLCVAAGTFNLGKSFVGRLRPNFFAACDYKGYGAALAEYGQLGDSSTLYTMYLNSTVAGALGDRSFCRASVAETDEASLSFPSGHAAVAFAGMTRLVAAVVGVGTLLAREAHGDIPGADIDDRGDIPGDAAEISNANDAQSSPRTIVAKGMDVAKSVVPYDAWYLHSVAVLPVAYACYVATSRITDYKHRPADVIAGALIGFAAAVACDGGVSHCFFIGERFSARLKRSEDRDEDSARFRSLADASL